MNRKLYLSITIIYLYAINTTSASELEFDAKGFCYYPGYALLNGNNFDNEIVIQLKDYNGSTSNLPYELINSTQLKVEINSPILELPGFLTFTHTNMNILSVWAPRVINSVSPIPLSGGTLIISGQYLINTRTFIDNTRLALILQTPTVAIFDIPNDIAKNIKESSKLYIYEKGVTTMHFKFANVTTYVFSNI